MTGKGCIISSALDHRTRVGQKRRERTRERLIEAAVVVFAERGLNGTVIDHVVRRAAVSRGTFYNYFDTVEDVLEAARVALGRELALLVEDSIAMDCPPQKRVALGLHMFIELACQNKLFLEFTARLGHHGYSFASMLREVCPDFIERGVELGVFRPIPDDLVHDITEAGVIAVLRRLMDGHEVDVDAFVAAMLRVLGIDYEESVALSSLPIEAPHIPEDSLLARGNAVWDQTH